MRSNKPIIAVDVDDVLLPHIQDLMQWYNATYATSLTLADNESDDIHRWGADSEGQAIQQVQRYFTSSSFLEAMPFVDAKAVLRHLSQTYELVVVTARDTIIEVVTRNWLEEHFTGLLSEAHFTAAYSLKGASRRKVDICLEIGASYLIDDSLRNAIPVAQAGMQAILFGNYPWNQTTTQQTGLIRCADWLAVQKYFDEQ